MASQEQVRVELHQVIDFLLDCFLVEFPNKSPMTAVVRHHIHQEIFKVLEKDWEHEDSQQAQTKKSSSLVDMLNNSHSHEKSQFFPNDISLSSSLSNPKRDFHSEELQKNSPTIKSNFILYKSQNSQLHPNQIELQALNKKHIHFPNHHSHFCSKCPDHIDNYEQSQDSSKIVLESYSLTDQQQEKDSQDKKQKAENSVNLVKLENQSKIDSENMEHQDSKYDKSSDSDYVLETFLKNWKNQQVKALIRVNNKEEAKNIERTIKPVCQRRLRKQKQMKPEERVGKIVTHMQCEIDERKKEKRNEQKRGRKPENPVMEAKLLGWIHECLDSEILPTQKQIRNMAKQLCEEHHFRASKGWLEKFLKRNQTVSSRLALNREEISFQESRRTVNSRRNAKTRRNHICKIVQDEESQLSQSERHSSRRRKKYYNTSKEEE